MTDTRAANEAQGPPLGESVALAATLGIAAFIPLLTLVKAVVHPVYLPELHYSQNQHSETALYVLTFAVVLPAVVWFVPALARWLDSRLGVAVASVFRAFLSGSLLVAILVARVFPGGGIVTVLVAFEVWALVALGLFYAATGGRAGGFEQRLGRYAWPVVGALLVLSVLAFTDLGSISLIGLAVASLAAVVVIVVPVRRPRWLPGAAVDAGILILLALTVPDLAFLSPAQPDISSTDAFITSVIQFHQDFFMGPANVVLHGGAVLVDTASQYGVGSIYAVAGWFELVPIGYGQLTILDAALYVLYLGTGYAILRFAGVSRGLASLAIAFSLVVLIYNLLYPVGALLQHGPLRFGIPMIVIVGAVAEARSARWRRAGLSLQCLAVGLASIWAFEALAASAVTFLALRGLAAWTQEGARLRAFGRDIALAVAASLACQAVLALTTLAFRGAWPDWGDYLAFLHQFLAGGIGEITYDFPTWSPGLLVGCASFISAAGLLILVRSRPGLVSSQRPLVTALCGVTAFEIVLFYYFVDRSASHVLPYVSFPLVLAGALWLTLLSATTGRTARVTRWAFGLAAATAVLLTSVAWSSVGPRLSASPLGRLAPGGQTLGQSMHDLWHLPPIRPSTEQGEALMDRYMPGDGPAALVLNSDLQQELLIRSGRKDFIPFGDPIEDAFAGTRFRDDLGDGVDALRPGMRVLTSSVAPDVISQLRADPARDPFADPIITPDSLTGEQEWVLRRIDEEFHTRVIHRDSTYVVLELVGRRSGARAST